MRTREDKSSSTSGSLPVVPDQAGALARLREENARLRAELAQLRPFQDAPSRDASWQTAMDHGIGYADGRSATSAMSAGPLLRQLTGLTKERLKAGRIRDSSDFDDLPKPSADEAKLESDFVRWGYCLVEDAMSPSQVRDQVDRMTEAGCRGTRPRRGPHDEPATARRSWSTTSSSKAPCSAMPSSSRPRQRNGARWWIAC